MTDFRTKSVVILADSELNDDDDDDDIRNRDMEDDVQGATNHMDCMILG